MKQIYLVILIYILLSLGKSYAQGLKMEEIESKLVELVKTYEEKYPENSIEKIIPFNKAAEVYRQIGQPAKAIPLYEKVFSIQKVAEHTDPSGLIETTSNLYIVYAVVGDYKKALGYANEYSSLLKKYQPNNDQAIYSAMNKIATMNLGLENYEEAEQAYLDLLALSNTLFKAKKSSIAATHHNLGVLYIKTKSYKLSEESLLLALSQKKSIFGEKHKEVGMTLSVLSKLYSDMGRISESKKAKERSIELLGYDPLEQ